MQDDKDVGVWSWSRRELQDDGVGETMELDQNGKYEKQD